MTNQEIWNEIVDSYDNNLNEPENIIQHEWEKHILPKYLCYEKDNIKSQYPLKMGSTNKKLDILLEHNRQKLCVLELKQHTLQQVNGQDQLISYLRQLSNVKLGILVCDKLFVYHFDHNIKNNELAHIEIPFKKDNENGIKFANLFKATNVDLNKIISWIDEEHKAKKIAQEKANKRKEQIQTIRDEITDNLKNDLLYKHFKEKYNFDDNVLQDALNNQNVTPTSTPLPKNPRIPNNFPKNNILVTEWMDWMINKGYLPGTVSSYSTSLNKIESHQASLNGINIWTASINELEQLVADYSTGKYKAIGKQGHGSVRAALKKFVEFRKSIGQRLLLP